MTRTYTNGATKLMELPVKYQAGFLKDFDKRTELYQLLTTSYNEVMSDLGGADILSHVQIGLVERYVFLEFTLRALETRIVKYPKKSGPLIGRWVQAMNTFMGLSKTLGLKRQARKVPTLTAYVKDKDRKRKKVS